MKKVIALDIGGTNFRGALFDDKFNILKRDTLSTKRGSNEEFFQEAKILIDSLIDDEVIALAIGVPGRVSFDGYIYALPNMGITNVDLVKFLKENYKLPVKIRNDAEIAAIGEANLGAGKDKKSLYFITISTGLGGALCINKDFRISSGEVGHELIKYQGKLEEYEHLVSGSGIVNLAKKNKLKISSSKEFFELVKNNDPKAQLVYEDWLKLLSTFIRYVKNTFEPEIIAVTGGVMKAKDLFFEELISKSKTPLVECELKEDAGLYGAAIEAFRIAK